MATKTRLVLDQLLLEAISDYISVANVTVNGFDVYLNKQGGGAAGDITVQWIATNDGVV